MHSTLDLIEIVPMAAGSLPALTASAITFQAKFPDKDLLTGDLAKTQQMWDNIVSDDSLNHLLSRLNQIHCARLLAAKEPQSGSWLKALPIPQCCFHLDDETIRISVAPRLGAFICKPHTCRCSVRVDRLGHDVLSCL